MSTIRCLLHGHARAPLSMSTEARLWLSRSVRVLQERLARDLARLCGLDPLEELPLHREIALARRELGLGPQTLRIRRPHGELRLRAHLAAPGDVPNAAVRTPIL